MKQIFLLGMILLLLTANAWTEQDENRKQLEKIQQRIENTRLDLREKKQSEREFSRELAVLERTLRNLDSRISALQTEQRQLQGKVEQQQRQVASDRQHINRIGKRLERRLVALYKEGEIGPLKILFSADSPTELVQQYHYLTRVLQYDRELLAEYRTAVELHQHDLLALEKLNQQKTALLESEQQQRKIADEGRRLQAQLLKQVKAEKKQLTQELAALQERAKRLQGLVSRLQQDADRSPVSQPEGLSFATGKGKLDWPIAGEVLIGFGTQKDKSLGTFYESNGIEIAAPPGSPIRAVATGKVVFADWFKGYGNLLIVNHPGGFHTLYAQAEQLNKAPGEQVRAGEVVGKSGLGGRDSIYFEIRQNGSPVNPAKWLKHR